MKTILLAAFLLYAGNEVAWAQIRHLYSAEKLAGSIGQGCVAQDALDMQSKQGTEVFSVRCKDSREFLLRIRKNGTVSATECKQASAHCFKTYDEQGG
jgi:hypothetical protein